MEGALEGIKGQYLLLSAGVINVRKYTGYEAEVATDAPPTSRTTVDPMIANTDQTD